MGRPPKDPADRYRTPLASYRIPPALRAEAKATAADLGETETAFVLRAIANEIRRQNRRKK